MKYKELLVKKEVSNIDYLPTTDYVSLESSIDYSYRNRDSFKGGATDFAIYTGASTLMDSNGVLKGPFYLRTASPVNNLQVKYIAADGTFGGGVFVDNNVLGIRPQISIDVNKYIQCPPNNKLGMKMFAINSERVLYFGKYPRNLFYDQDKLDTLFNEGNLDATGTTYMGRYESSKNSIVCHPEYIDQYGNRYVRFPVFESMYNNNGSIKLFTNGQRLQDYAGRDYLWFNVGEIGWVIKNWENLPKEINPQGDGTAKTIDMYSLEILRSGIPFYPYIEDDCCHAWQNSTIRGYLNGYDMRYVNSVTNGAVYHASRGGNFGMTGGFLAEAMDREIESTQSQVSDITEEIKNHVTTKKSRLAQLNPDDTAESDRRQMTDKELIQSWVDAGRSVLLRGPSGIGKTEKLKELYPDLIYLKLTNNMFPEKVVGSMNLQTGQSIPPDFAKQAILACATDEERALVEKNIQNLYKIADEVYERSKTAEGKVVIMLDELLNVKPAVQSLVYTLVLNKIVENGNGMKLPANTVIVATGNQKKYSSVAEDLAEPLEKRFDHIYDMQPKVGEWIYEYAIPNNIHPSVVSYILNKYMCQDKSEEISDMGYFYEEPEIGEEKLDIYGCKGRTNDPRGWTSISNMLYSFEDNLTKGKYKGKDVEHILDTSLKSKLREEWAADFMDFYNNPTISVEDVVAGNYTEADLPQDINERFAYVSGLIGADEKQLPKVRDFIRKYCDPEYVELYDITWVGKSDERAEQLAEVKSWQDAEWKEEHAAEKDVIEEKTEEHVGDKERAKEVYRQTAKIIKNMFGGSGIYGHVFGNYDLDIDTLLADHEQSKE